MGRIADRIRLPAGAAVLALLVALASGCSANPPVERGPAAAQAETPLEVWLPGPYDLHVGPWAVFHLNRPAYVAIFDIVPGRAVRALYPYDPAAGAQRRFHSGIQTVLTGRGPGSGFASAVASCTGTGIHLPVVWRMIVASERPLDLRRLRPQVAFRYRPAIGAVHFAGGTAFRTMDDILQIVLPATASPDPAAGSEWAVDYVAYWSSSSCRPSTTLALLPVDIHGRTPAERPTRPRTQAPDGDQPDGNGDDAPEDAPEELEELDDRLAGVPGATGRDGAADGTAPRVRDEGRGLDSPDDGLRAGAPEARPGELERRHIKRRTFLPDRTDRRGFDHAVGRNRVGPGQRASKGLRYLPNARIPTRTLAPPPQAATPRPGVRAPDSSARPAPRMREQPLTTPAPRPTPKVRPAPKAKGKDSSSGADRDKQK